MPIKKKNIYSFNLTEKAVLYLQGIGYIQKNKKINKEKNLSRFMNERIIEHGNLQDPNYMEEYDKLILLSKIKELCIQRDTYSEEISILADELNNMKEKKIEQELKILN